MLYTFTFTNKDYSSEYKQTTEVHPVFYSPKIVYHLPVKEKFLVWDGNDFYAHHRRVDLNHFVTIKLGMTKNSGMFAYDFCPINKAGEMFMNKGKKMRIGSVLVFL